MFRKYLLIIFILFLCSWFLYKTKSEITSEPVKYSETEETINSSEFFKFPESKETEVTLTTAPDSKTLQNNYHIYQTFNNCGPAALSMALSYYNINVSQKELGDALRPYQIASGDNDDKSVTLEELAKKAEDYDLTVYHRPNGNIDIVRLFITYDIPIITRTWLKTNEDIGHYRIIKGYDDSRKVFIQDDSLQGQNLEYTYDEFEELWKKFNYEYLVLIPKDKVEIAKAIQKDNVNKNFAWKLASQNAQKQMDENPTDIIAKFNLAVALTNIGDHEGAIKAYESVESRLSERTLWYQIEPIESYYEVGNYDRVFEITNKILNNHNKAFSELYILRGKSYEKQNMPDLAKQEFDKARYYNKNIIIN